MFFIVEIQRPACASHIHSLPNNSSVYFYYYMQKIV